MSQHDHRPSITQRKDKKSNINIPHVTRMQVQNDAELHYRIIHQSYLQKHQIVIKK